MADAPPRGPIHPTHSCFDDALEYLEDVILRSGEPRAYIIKNYRLVHGIYTVPESIDRPGQRNVDIAHAWVLDKARNQAVQSGIVGGERITYGVDLAEYYTFYRCRHETRYTLAQAWRLNKRHGNYGPWEEQYIRLCRDKLGVP